LAASLWLISYLSGNRFRLLVASFSPELLGLWVFGLAVVCFSQCDFRLPAFQIVTDRTGHLILFCPIDLFGGRFLGRRVSDARSFLQILA